MAQTLDSLALDIRLNVSGLAEVQQVQRRMQGMDRQIKNSGQAMNQFGRAATGAARDTNRFAMGALQQAGYQVGDFYVQVANGTSAMQAFGQQGAQFFGIFGPIGAVLGAGVAIFSAFAVAAERSAGAVNQASDALDAMRNTNLDSIRNGINDLVQIQNNYNEALRSSGDASSSAARVLIANSEAEFNARKQLLSVEIELLRIRSQDQVRALETLRRTQEGLRQDAMEELRTIGPGATFDIRDATGGFAGAGPSFEDITAPISGTIEMLRENRREILILEAELARLGIASDEAAEAINMVFNPSGVTEMDAGGGGGGGGAAGRAIREIVDELSEAQQAAQSVARSMEASFEKGFMAMVDGTMTVKDAFRMMAADIIRELYRVLVVQRLVGSFTPGAGGTGIVGSIMGALGFRAMGGPMTANQPYIVGERGPELVVPSRNGTVIPNNQLGGQQPIVVNYNFQGGVTEADLARALPVFVQRTKREIVDAVQRGGSMSRAFG